MRYTLSNPEAVCAAGRVAIRKKIDANIRIKLEAGDEIAEMIYSAAKMWVEGEKCDITSIFNYRGFPSTYHSTDGRIVMVDKNINLSKLFTFGACEGDIQDVTFNL